MFNYALGWLVTRNVQCSVGWQQERNTIVLADHAEHGHVSRWKGRQFAAWFDGWNLFWVVVTAASAVLALLCVNRCLPSLHWVAASKSMVAGEVERACADYREAYAQLNWNGRFCAYYGDATMVRCQEKAGEWIDVSGGTQQAIFLYERSKYSFPNSYMFEKLAQAYLKLADEMNWPVRVQTDHRMETPVQALLRKAREWRCGSNLFFEPPPTELTRGDCIGRAINYLTLASNILPWRLTSKWYLADVFCRLGDTNKAIEYAQLVVNIPMKKYSERGVELKLKAQKMLNELGVQCDDPGLVVFDIHDRSTWNEGKW
jgi:hypothetical protein